MQFEWHEDKAKQNSIKHSVSFIAFADPDHSDDEFRELLLGHSKFGRYYAQRI
jgi:uncharacterized DUF497 family protein